MKIATRLHSNKATLINIKNINLLISSYTFLFLKLVGNLYLYKNYSTLIFTEESNNVY